MEDLRLVSTVSDGSLGDRLKRSGSKKCDLSCSLYTPKIRSRKVSVVRDFPDNLSGFGRHIGQKANDDHACERDYGSCTRDFEPNTGLGCDFEDVNVESSSKVADEEFVAQLENAGTIDSMRTMNPMTVNDVKVEDGDHPQLGNENIGSLMASMTLPKRRKVSAVRDFPDAFQQFNGHNSSRKKAYAVHDFPVARPEDAGTIDSMRIMNRMIVNVKVEDVGYTQLGNGHNGSVVDSMTLPKRRKVSAVRDFPDAFQQFNEHNGSRKKASAVHDFPVTQLENAGAIGSMRIHRNMNRMTANAKVEDVGYPQLGNEYNGSIMDSMKVSAVPDFPDAFRQGNEQNGSQKKESAHREFPDAFKQCNEKNSSQKKAIISFDAVQVDSDDLNVASKVDVDLEPSNTDFVPLKDTAETEVNLLNLSGQELMYTPDKEKVLKLPADLLDSEERVASVTPLATLHVSEWNEKEKDSIPLAIQEHDYAEFINQKDAIEQPKLENDRAGEDFCIQLEISKPAKLARMQVEGCLTLDHKTTAMKMPHKVTAVRDFSDAFKLGEDNGSRSDFPLVREPVTPNISIEQGKVKSFPGHNLATKELEHGKIVQALMASPRCPWRSKKSRGSKEGKY